jgi:hypothetical protein
VGQKLVKEVLEVLYSPVKAFEKIVKNPSVQGPLLVLALTLLATAVLQTVAASKYSFLTATPENDNWTESKSLWNSNGELSIDGAEGVVGNYSVKSSVTNNTYIWMNITDIGQFNCSGETGYKVLSFRIKWIHQNETFPSSNATVRLFSNNQNSYLELDLLNLINSNDRWANVTVEVGSDNPNWTSPISSDWETITGLEFRLPWSDAANLTLKIDDLHFGKYVSLLTEVASTVIIISSLNAAVAFFFSWATYGVFLLMFIVMFHKKTGSLTKFFVVIGHSFIVTTVYILVIALLFSTLPHMQVTAKTFEEQWTSNWVYQLGIFLDFIFEAWMAVLFAIAIHFFSQLTWRKAAVISTIASILGLIVTRLL